MTSQDLDPSDRGVARAASPILANTQAVDVTIAIVNWNTNRLLKQCLSSLAGGTAGVRTQIIVIDNASQDGSAGMVSQDFPNVRLIANRDNFGYAWGNNQAYALAEGRHILLLNPDTVVRPGAVQAMMEFLDRHPQAAGATCRLLNPDGSFQRYYKRLPSWKHVLATFTVFHNLWPRNRWSRDFYMVEETFDRILEIEQPPAACLMLRHSMLQQQAIFDERFPIFFNDIDFCRSLSKRGYNLVFLPSAEIVHYGGHGGVNLMKDDAVIDYLINLIRYFRKHEGSWPGIGLWLILIVDSLLVLGVGLLKVTTTQRPAAAFGREFRRRLRLAIGREIFQYPADSHITTT